MLKRKCVKCKENLTGDLTGEYIYYTHAKNCLCEKCWQDLMYLFYKANVYKANNFIEEKIKEIKK